MSAIVVVPLLYVHAVASFFGPVPEGCINSPECPTAVLAAAGCAAAMWMYRMRR